MSLIDFRKPLIVSTDPLYGKFSRHAEYQTSWYVPLTGSTITPAAVHEQKVGTALVLCHYWCVTGVHPLSSLVFHCYRLDSRACHRGIAWLKGSHLPDLNFMDYFAALAESAHDLQNLVTSISHCAAGLDPTINAKKTKNMLTWNHQHDTDIYINQNKTESVGESTYF